jgi:hypothetical protein
MEFRIQRKVSFVEEAIIEADSMEEAKEKLKKATLDWNVDFDYDPTIESIIITDYEYDNEEELPTDYMEEDFVSASNGCIIFNKEEFERIY